MITVSRLGNALSNDVTYTIRIDPVSVRAASYEPLSSIQAKASAHIQEHLMKALREAREQGSHYQGLREDNRKLREQNQKLKDKMESIRKQLDAAAVRYKESY